MTPQQKRMSEAAKSCSVEVREKIEEGKAGRGSLFKMLGDCVGDKLRSGKRKKARKAGKRKYAKGYKAARKGRRKGRKSRRSR